MKRTRRREGATALERGRQGVSREVETARDPRAPEWTEGGKGTREAGEVGQRTKGGDVS